MAKNTNNQELKERALASIAQGRAEISAGVHRLRRRLSPTQVIHRAFDRHTSLVTILALSAAAIPVLFIFRSKTSGGRARRAVMASVTPPPSKPVMGAFLMGALGLLARTITPTLIKSSIVPHVLDYLSKKGATPPHHSSAGTGERQKRRNAGFTP